MKRPDASVSPSLRALKGRGNPAAGKSGLLRQDFVFPSNDGLLDKAIKDLTFLILSGPTREYLDPVRFISNESSGKMGTALAKQALKKGAKVIFISGPSRIKPENGLSKRLKITDVVSADEMFAALKKNFNKADIIIGAAAVSDFKPVSLKKQKIKKGPGQLFVTFAENPDIIAYCGKNKKKQVVAGFALETENLFKNAAGKLKEKKLDIIVANGKEAMNSDKSAVCIITAEGRKIPVKKSYKNKTAEIIINETIRVFERIKTCKTLS